MDKEKRRKTYASPKAGEVGQEIQKHASPKAVEVGQEIQVESM